MDNIQIWLTIRHITSLHLSLLKGSILKLIPKLIKRGQCAPPPVAFSSEHLVLTLHIDTSLIIERILI